MMKKFLLSFAVMLMGTALFTACNDKDDSPSYVTVAVSNGAYVINGGNMSSNINSSLTYIDYATQTAAQNQFAARNGRSLGLTANDAIVYGDKLYIVVTNENTIEVVDRKTLKSIKQIKTTDLMGAEKGVMPRRITAINGILFVSTYGSSAADWSTYETTGNGYVAAIDTVNFALQATFKAGSYPEGVVVANNNLYVANSDYSMCKKASISVINITTGLESSITSDKILNPTSLAIAGNDVYVLDMGNYNDVPSGIRRVRDGSVTSLMDATHVAFMGSNIYACNSIYGTIPTEFYIYNIQSDTKQTLPTGLDGKFFSPNVIAVDPVTGKIYMASYNENADRPGYANYSSNGYVAEYDAAGNLLKTYDCGVGPNAIVFNAGYEVRVME